MAQKPGVYVDGLDETLRGLGRADRTVAKEVVKIIRTHTKTVALAARKVTPHDASPTRRTFITWRANRRGSSIVLKASKEPRAVQEEFGAHTWMVGFDRNVKRPQQFFDNRPTRPWKRDGYVIQPTIEASTPKFVKELGNDIEQFYRRLMARGR